MVTMNAIYQGEKHVYLTHGPSRSVLETDAPKDNNGRGESFSPTDLVASGLAACAMTVMAIRAEKLGIELKGMSASVNKVMAENPRRIARLPLTIRMPAGLIATPAIREELESVARSCPVAQSLSPAIEVPMTFDYIQSE